MAHYFNYKNHPILFSKEKIKKVKSKHLKCLIVYILCKKKKKGVFGMSFLVDFIEVSSLEILG